IGCLLHQCGIALLNAPAPCGADVFDLLVDLGQRRLLPAATEICSALRQEAQIVMAVPVLDIALAAAFKMVALGQMFRSVLAHQPKEWEPPRARVVGDDRPPKRGLARPRQQRKGCAAPLGRGRAAEPAAKHRELLEHLLLEHAEQVPRVTKNRAQTLVALWQV